MRRRGFFGMIGAAIAAIGTPWSSVAKLAPTAVDQPYIDFTSDRKGSKISYVKMWTSNGVTQTERVERDVTRAYAEGLIDAFWVAGHDIHSLAELLGETDPTIDECYNLTVEFGHG